MRDAFISKTDKGLIIDVVIPGFGKDDVKVTKFVDFIGEDAVDILRVSGKYTRPTGETGKLVPRFAFDKVVDEKFKMEFPVDDKYDVEKLRWGIKNGVLRIRVGLQDWAIGEEIESVDNVEVGDTDAPTEDNPIDETPTEEQV
jgi:HSP20 family molecular chaperone IbpA